MTKGARIVDLNCDASGNNMEAHCPQQNIINYTDSVISLPHLWHTGISSMAEKKNNCLNFA